VKNLDFYPAVERRTECQSEVCFVNKELISRESFYFFFCSKIDIFGKNFKKVQENLLAGQRFVTDYKSRNP